MQHMQRTAQQGKGAASVPESIKHWYRRLNPEMTDAEITKAYNRYKN